MGALLVVQRVDTAHRDPAIDAGCLKRGMVIQVLPDDADVGTLAISNLDWAMLRVDADPEDLTHLEAREVPSDDDSDTVLRCRVFRLDLDHPAFDDAGMRPMLDAPIAAPVATIDGKRLDQIVKRERVEIHESNVQETRNDKGQVTKVVVHPDTIRVLLVESYDVAELRLEIAERLNGLNMTRVEAYVRDRIVADVDRALLDLVTVRTGGI